jgi:flagellar motor switch protein FliM
MTEFLRQQDIDALMQGEDHEISARKEPSIISYSFLRPPRVVKHRRKILEVMHDRFALGLQGMLAARLRAPTDIVIASVESLTFAEFKMVLASPCASYVFRAGHGTGSHAIIDFSTPLALHLVDRLLGGPGQSGDIKRALTSLEQGVVRAVAERSLSILRDAWKEQVAIETEIVRYESDPEMIEITNPDDAVLLANYEVRSGGFTGYITTCFTMDVLDPVVHDRIGPTGNGNADLHNGSAQRALATTGLGHARVGITVRMPPFRLSAREFADLKAGSTVQTPHYIDTPVEVYINDRLWFLGTTGQLKSQVGLRIAQSILGEVSRRQGHIREGRVL